MLLSTGGPGRASCHAASLLVALCVTVNLAPGSLAHAAGVNFTTVFGGSGQDYAASVASDYVLVTRWSSLPDFPLQNALKGTKDSGASLFRRDAFITQLDPTGSKLTYSTYVGGPDDVGNAYVAGQVGVATGVTSVNPPSPSL